MARSRSRLNEGKQEANDHPVRGAVDLDRRQVGLGQGRTLITHGSGIVSGHLSL